MKRIIGWAMLFLVLCMGAAWASYAPFPHHILVVIAFLVAMFAALIGFTLALAHAFSNGGGW